MTWEKSAAGEPGNVSTEGFKATYSSGGLVTPAALATDIAILNGSATKTIRVTRVTASVEVTTAGIIDLLLIKRSVADGAASSTPAIAAHDSNDAAASAVLGLFTANPSLGAAVATIRAIKAGPAANVAAIYAFDFTTRNSKGVVLRGVAQGLAVNLNGDTLLAGEVWAVDFEWTEE